MHTYKSQGALLNYYEVITIRIRHYDSSMATPAKTLSIRIWIQGKVGCGTGLKHLAYTGHELPLSFYMMSVTDLEMINECFFISF